MQTPEARIKKFDTEKARIAQNTDAIIEELVSQDALMGEMDRLKYTILEEKHKKHVRDQKVEQGKKDFEKGLHRLKNKEKNSDRRLR